MDKLKISRYTNIAYLFASLAFCFRLDKYNKLVKELQNERKSDLQILAANNGEAVILFLIALILVIASLFICYFSIRSTSQYGESLQDWIWLIFLIIITMVADYYVIELISIPILQILLRVVIAGGAVLGLVYSSN